MSPRRRRSRKRKGNGGTDRHTLDPQDRAPLPCLNIDVMDIVLRDAVVEELGVLIREMAKAVPLRRDLRIEGPDVIVNGPGYLGDEFPVQRGALEEGLVLGLRV